MLQDPNLVLIYAYYLHLKMILTYYFIYVTNCWSLETSAGIRVLSELEVDSQFKYTLRNTLTFIVFKLFSIFKLHGTRRSCKVHHCNSEFERFIYRNCDENENRFYLRLLSDM